MLPFLVGQNIRVLCETKDVKRFLHPDFFRTRRQTSDGQSPDQGQWQDVSREELVRVIGASGFRGVLTTDAGLGKSSNVEYLQQHIQQAFPSKVCIRVCLGEIESRNQSSILDYLNHDLTGIVQRQFEKAGTPIDKETIKAWLQRTYARSNLIVLFDQLDQVAADSQALDMVERMLKAPTCDGCSILIAGRPYSLHQNWDRLLAQGSWRFFQSDGFTSQQQRTFLRDGEEDRYALLPAEVRVELNDLLEVPRVLSYLRKLGSHEFSQIHTASDIYLGAIDHLIRAGLSTARTFQFGCSKQSDANVGSQGMPMNWKPANHQVERALYMLAATAWEMIWQPPPLSISQVNERRGKDPRAYPNFDRVVGKTDIRNLRQAVFERLPKDLYGDRGLFDKEFELLASINETIEFAFADSLSDQTLLWRNTSLQEFLAAYALTCMCRDDGADQERLKYWRHVQSNPNSDKLYWVWRFTAEMHTNHIEPEAWCAAMKSLYLPGDGTIAGTVRSTEMIYRTWDRMDAYGPEIVASFQSEFESILSGTDERARAAQEFVQGFLEVPAATPFRMGTPLEKQGRMPESQREYYANWLNDADATPDSFMRVNDHWFAPGKAGNQQRANIRRVLTKFFEKRDISVIEDWEYTKDETPASDWVEPEVATFQLQQYPTLRSWYRLFDPGHGQRGEWFASNLNHVASTGDHPVFYVSWYDAWVFCKFAYWEGQCCRLPHEDEWEKAAKAARCIEECDWNYWWGDDDEEDRRTADQPITGGHSSSPLEHAEAGKGERHKNWLGFVDILGNQWEWTEDEYRRCYSRTTPPDSPSRVARGGSWSTTPANVRSSVRVKGAHPTSLYLVFGFRVARARL